MNEEVNKDKQLPELSEFFTDQENGRRTCKQCGMKLKTKQSSTTSLHRHLEGQHNIFAYKHIKEPKTRDAVQTTSSIEILSQQFPLEAKLSRMTASDGISFNLFQTSEDLRDGVQASYSKIRPKVVLKKSASTIKEAVMRFGGRLKDQLRTMFQNKLKAGEYFSVDFDEWVSLANKRYLNLTLLSKGDQYWNLGLVRITGKASAANLLNLVDQRLENFGLDRQKHIVAFVTDGCKVMEKLHNESMIEHQLCLAHAIQLAVVDVLYSKESVIVEDIDDEVDEYELDDANVATGLEMETCEDVADFRSKTLKDIIGKVRKLGSHFKRSSVDADKLRDLVKSTFHSKEGKSLKLDSPTRWSSLYLMLERYYEIKDCVDSIVKSLKGFDVKLTVDENFLVLCILKTLRPVKATVEALCNRKCNLLRARVALQMLFKQLERQKNPFAQKFSSRLRERIYERWTVNSGVLSYLHNGSYSDLSFEENDSSDEEDDETDADSSRFYTGVFEDVVGSSKSTTITMNDIFDIPSKSEITKHLIQLITRLCPNDLNIKEKQQPQRECSIEEPPMKKKKTFEERLSSAVHRFETKSLIPQPSAISKILTQEMNFLEKNKTRGQYLEKCYNMLSSIKPTSVESERAFSSAGMLCTKLRTRYNDNTLDTLAFLRSHLKKLKSSTSIGVKCTSSTSVSVISTSPNSIIAAASPTGSNTSTSNLNNTTPLPSSCSINNLSI